MAEIVVGDMPSAWTTSLGVAFPATLIQLVTANSEPVTSLPSTIRPMTAPTS